MSSQGKRKKNKHYMPLLITKKQLKKVNQKI